MGMGRIGRIYAFAGAAAWLAAPALWTGCSAAPIKIECQEIRTRLAYENMSEDQARFARQELEDCEARVRAAQAKDSAFVDKAEGKLTPED